MSDVPIPRSIVSRSGNYLDILPSGAARVTGDVRISDPIVIGTVNVSVDISGDTQVINGSTPLLVHQGGTRAVSISGDNGLMADVRDYVDADALAVANTPSGDRTYWGETISLNDATPADGVVIHTPASGKRFYIDTLVLATGTSGEVQFKSSTGNISGSMPLAANGGIAIDHASLDERAKLKGAAINNTFNIKLSRTMQVGGYVTGYDQ